MSITSKQAHKLAMLKLECDGTICRLVEAENGVGPNDSRTAEEWREIYRAMLKEDEANYKSYLAKLTKKKMKAVPLGELLATKVDPDKPRVKVWIEA